MDWLDGYRPCEGTPLKMWDVSYQKSKQGKWARAECADMCARCPVLAECAADALATRAVGVFRAGIACNGSNSASAPTRYMLEVVAGGI